MINLKKISLYELPELIHLSYKGDNELLQKYHIAPMDLETAIQSTFSMIHTASRLKKLNIYKVIFEKQPIGYVVTYDDNFLYSYALAPKFRKKNILIDWWHEIRKVLDSDFRTMIYSNNTRAIDFLKRQSMAIEQEDKQNQIVT